MPTCFLFGRSAYLLALVFSGCTLAGCGGGGQSGLDGPDPTALSASAKAADGLTATLTQDKATTTTGAPLNYTFTLSNPTAQAVTVQAYGPPNAQGSGDMSTAAPVAFLEIIATSGKTVYPDPNTVQSALGMPTISVSLPPGHEISEKVTVPGRLLPSGRYQASADFSAFNSGAADGMNTLVGPLTVSVR